MNNKAIYLLIGGLILFVISLALAPTVISSTVTAAATTGIGSFGGVSGILGLYPLIFVVGGLLLGLGAMIGGAVSGYKGMK